MRYILMLLLMAGVAGFNLGCEAEVDVDEPKRGIDVDVDEKNGGIEIDINT